MARATSVIGNSIIFVKAVVTAGLILSGVYPADQVQAQPLKVDSAVPEKKDTDPAILNGRIWLKGENGGMETCYWSSTYDSQEKDALQNPNAVGGHGDLRDYDQRKSDYTSLHNAMQEVKVGWAKRSACFRDIQHVDSVATGIGAAGYLISKGNADPDDATPWGYLALTPIILDELRSVSPLKRMYSGAVVGVAKIQDRDEEMARLLGELTTKASNSSLNVGTVDKQSPAPCSEAGKLEVSAKNIQKDVGKMFGDDPNLAEMSQSATALVASATKIEVWCKQYSEYSKQRVLLSQTLLSRYDAYRVAERTAWTSYVNFINGIGDKSRASAFSVLNKIVSTPFVIAGKLLGSEPDTVSIPGNVAVQGRTVQAAAMPALLDGSMTVTNHDASAILIFQEYIAVENEVYSMLEQRIDDLGKQSADDQAAKAKANAKALNTAKIHFSILHDDWRLVWPLRNVIQSDQVEWDAFLDNYAQLKYQSDARFVLIDLDNGAASLSGSAITTRGTIGGEAPGTDAASAK